jgi:HEAT repeat protein
MEALLAAIAAGEDEQAEAAAQAVGPMGDAALPMLRDLLASDDRDRRWWAVRAMAAVGTAAAVDQLIAALGDPNPDVRACAVVALAEHRPAAAIEPLVACLSDPSAYVARLVADGLAQFGEPAAASLIEMLETGDVAARAGAARALSVIQPEEAIPALFAALDDPSAAVTYYAEEALARMGVGMVYFEP